MKLRMGLACPFWRLGFGCKLFRENTCGGLCGFVCQCCMCNKLGKCDGISVRAMGVMGSFEFRVVDGFA